MSDSIDNLVNSLQKGDFKSLAKAITLVENEVGDYRGILLSLPANKHVPVIGITGAPGVGKSTLINALVKHLISKDKKIAILAVDPTSPFNFGSLLGDRLRMPELFNNPNVFIRSLATRGSLGGLTEKIIEITDVVRASMFDYIFVETVGVGQSEVEVAGLADITIVVFVPESGDEIQTMKSGIMEIADIFVVNKCDREGADRIVMNLKGMAHDVSVVKTSASDGGGMEELASEIEKHSSPSSNEKRFDKKLFLLTEKAFRLIQKNKMKDINRQKIQGEIEKEMGKGDFNLYKFISKYEI